MFLFPDDVPSPPDLPKLSTLDLGLGVIRSIESSGEVVVISANGVLRCDVILPLCAAPEPLRVGQRVLVAVEPSGGAGSADRGIVLGRIGKYRPPEPAKPEAHVVVEATETLTLKCGEASVDLRKDGKVMVRGEDVLLRAKKTQRIKAGTVAIN